MSETETSQNDFAESIVNAIESLYSKHRRRILIELQEVNSLSYTALKERMGLVKGTFNYHLKILSGAGIVRNFILDQEGISYVSYYELSELGRRLVNGILNAYKPPTPKTLRVFASTTVGIEITDQVSTGEGEETSDAASVPYAEEASQEWISNFQRWSK